MTNPSKLSTIYVSQAMGNDGNTGFSPKSDSPFGGPVKSLGHAVELICWLRNSGHFQPVTIKVMDEVHFLENTLEIKDKQGKYGGEISNVIIEPYTKTRIVGAKRLTNFRDDMLNGVKCLSVNVPEVLNGEWYTDFYVNGERAKYTRFPERGTLDASEVENSSTALRAHSSWFKPKASDFEKISEFENLSDCIVSFNHYWIDEHTTIKSVAKDTGTVHFSMPSAYSLSPDYEASKMHYIVENVKETFKNPGEWYLDRVLAKLYYIPMAGQNAENIEAYLPVCGNMLEILGAEEKPVKNIYIRNLELAYNRGDACWVGKDGKEYASPGQSTNNGSGLITMKYAHNCAVENCVIHGSGIHAIRLDRGCMHIRIEENEMYDLGAGGVVVAGGDKDAPEYDRSGYNIIHNNLMKQLGRRYLASCGVLMCHSMGNVVSHNEISDLYYSGISAGWIWGYGESVSDNNLIEYNHIYNVGQGMLSDMAGIYLLGEQKGTWLRGNIIHDVEAKYYGGWGIYTDEGSSYIRVEKNLCYNFSHNCFHQHWGAENTLVNNIFARSKEHPIKFSHNEMHTGAIFEGNIIVSNGTPIYNFTEWVDGGSKNNCAHTHVAGGRRNILFDEMSKEAMILNIDGRGYALQDASKVFGLEVESIVENPKFADIDVFNFEVTNKLLLEKMGIKPIDVKKAGRI